MSEQDPRSSGSIGDLTRALVEDPAYRADFTARLEARTLDPGIVDRLIAYARARQATREHAIVRRVLTDAGVSWEAL